MVLGLAVIGWDRKMGTTFDFKYPETLNLTLDQINKIYMSHAFKQDNFEEKELIEIDLDDQILLSYCDKSRVATVGYEMVILILHQKQKINIDNLKSIHLEFAQSIIEKPKFERNTFILENIEKYFKKSTEKKIVIFGRPGTGKTSIKQVVFEGKSPKELINNPLEPTRGISPSVYSWLDLKLGLFDTSGQEFEGLLQNEYEQALIFDNSDIILYLFDFPMWAAHSDQIIKDVKNIKEIINRKSYNAKIILFLHKIDLINKTSRKNKLTEIENLLKSKLDLPIYFTSLYPELLYNTYNAFHNILSEFSKETSKLKSILDEQLKDSSKTMYFITNNNNSIITQSISKDFNFELVNHVHKITAQLTQSFKDMCLNDNIDHMLLWSKTKLHIMMKYLNLSEFNLLNIICVSETLTVEEMVLRAGIIKLYYSNYYYKLEK